MNQPQYQKRLEALQNQLEEHKLDALALNPGPDLVYFSGLDFHLMERPVVAVLRKEGQPLLILPALERGKLEDLPYPCRDFPYQEDRETWGKAFREALKSGNLSTGRLGIIPRRLRVLEQRFLINAAPQAELVDAQEVVSRLRMIKDPEEIRAMEEANRIARCALQTTLSAIEPGVTEKEIASKLVQWLLHHGSEPELPFFPIVSFGPNSANPHAVPTDRRLKEGELILIDWGANYRGYFSDITRTFAYGDLNPELDKVVEFVQEANAAGREAVQSGIQASRVDQLTRAVIEKAGYGDYFVHRTGHGLGLEAHEEPYITADENRALAPGMTFTIEPGIYLPGRGGVRIEDNLVVTETGARCLTSLPRELVRLDGQDPYEVPRT